MADIYVRKSIMLKWTYNTTGQNVVTNILHPEMTGNLLIRRVESGF